MNYTIFIEYKIKPESRQAYLDEVKKIRERLPASQLIQYEQLEATDQENLFVEWLKMDTLEHYHGWKKELSGENPDVPWNSIFPYIIGGKEKFNIWAFQPNQEQLD